MAAAMSLGAGAAAQIASAGRGLVNAENTGGLESTRLKAQERCCKHTLPLFTHASPPRLTVRAAAAAAVAVQNDTSIETKLPRLKGFYLQKVVPAMKEEFKYANILQVPRVEKVVVNCGVGEASQNAKVLESTVKDVSLITGQRPVVTRSKKAIAGFKLRQGVPVGVAVTLRGERMYAFLDRLLNLALPRTRDFQGVNPYGFDGKGNYTLGLPEQSVFPEIRVENIDRQSGMDVSIVTTAHTDKEGQKLLSLLGMPFKEAAARKIVPRKKGNFFYKGGKPRK
ncbi:hypothetical protein O6H91_03G118900 [Diphasiastrum complanatum]|uniref:Uncharacterized protein n=1 Tax=Diphasiastrum complanatum TaxID=34168 RepID=A0ACC2EAK6_DIPCM|nr:hypothetical protein O6H91_03G118900 [Diphasiastrum complanatum]